MGEREGRRVIAGLPAGTWALMALAVVPGIVLVVAAYRVHRHGDARDAEQRQGRGHGTGAGPEGQGGAPLQATRRGAAGRG